MLQTKTLTKAGAAAGALVLLASTAAMAGPPTYLTVNGVGSPSAAADFDGVSPGTVNFETDYGVSIACTPSSLAGKAYRGALIAATNPIGRTTGLSGTCIATDLLFDTRATNNFGDWDIVVKSAPAAAGDPIPVRIMNMSIYFKATMSCEFDAKAAPGVGVDAILYPGPIGGHDARLEIDTGASYPLVIKTYSGIGFKVPAPSSCGGEIVDGDLSRVGGTYNLDTTGAITGPISHS